MKKHFPKKPSWMIVGIVILLFMMIKTNAQTNLDFETGNLTGWTTANYGWSSNVATPVGFPTGGGTRVGKVVGGDDSWGGAGYEKLTQAFTVTSGNKDLTYRFKSYINNTYADVYPGYYHIRVYKTTTGTDYSNITGYTSTSNTILLDLTPCIGSSVTILFEVTAGWNQDVDAPTPAYMWVDASVPSTSAPPTAYAMTGGGSYCTGGAAVGLAGSQVGVNYTLIKNGTATATIVAGTGAAISFGSQLFGTYTASGTGTGAVPAIAGTTAMTGSAIVTVQNNITPTFTQLGPYCQNATPGTLPLTSLNGITGTWNPATIFTGAVSTITYTFTPTAGQCASTTTMDISVSGSVTPSFTQLGPYCVGATPGTLPTTSLNSITGTWDPSTISTATAGTTVYTFTPSSGGCATTATMSIVVNAVDTPTFIQLGPYCQNETPGTLPTTSLNGITGTWNAAISTATPGTTNYTFTPTAGQCATTATMSVVVNANVTPTFTQLGPYCVGATPGTLPTTSLNSITGTWNAPISTATAGTTVYTFTPTSGGCVTTATMSVVVNAVLTPTFTQLGPYAVGSTPGTLPATSLNGITGTWDAAISTAVAGTTVYTFTPSAGQCATTATMSILIFTSVTPAPSPPFQWAKDIGAAGWSASGTSVVTDASGNVYTVGWFNSYLSPMDFNPGTGPADTCFLSSNGNYDIFIQKMDANGNFLWAKSIGAVYDDYPTSVAIDGSGNLYLVGTFTQNVDFDPGPGSYYLDYGNSYGLFILKLDTDGNFVWVKGVLPSEATISTSTDQIWGKSIALDGSGNICIAGYFDGVNVDFDPAPGPAHEFIMASAAFYGDAFIAKYDPSGNFVWAKQLKGSGGNISDTYGIKTDASGNVYTTGYYMGTVDFDPGPPGFMMSSKLNTYDIYVLKLNASGIFVWAKSLSGNANEKGLSISLDASSNVYTTGYFSGWVDFNPKTGIADTCWLQSKGGNDIFISKLDVNGSFVWAKSIGGTGDDQGLSVFTDPASNVYIAGYYYGTVDFDPGAGYYPLTSAGASDIFVLKLDNSGNFAWANSMGGPGYDAATSVNIDYAGSVIITGNFAGTADFDASAATYYLTSQGSTDVFINKMGALAPVAFAVSGGGSYCQGSGGLPVGLGNSEAGVQYTILKNGVPQVPTVAGTGSAISFGNQLFGAYTVSGTNAAGTTPMTGSAVLAEAIPVVVEVSISADVNPVPAGSSVTLTAVPVNGGLTPAYQWKVNGINVGTGNAVYSYIPANNDAVTCTLTSSEACSTGNPVVSNVINLTVIPLVTNLENIIVADGQTTCYSALQTIYIAGGITTFTVQPGGSATMIAGQNIVYLPGTTVLSGGYMLGMISTGTYCPGQAKSLISADAGSDENLFNINQVNFTIYPNPTTGNFTLVQKGDKLYGNVTVEVFSMRGEKVMTETIIGEKMHDFRFSDMATGLYFVKVVADGYVETMKLIKL